jgi:hypothetical protein
MEFIRTERTIVSYEALEPKEVKVEFQVSDKDEWAAVQLLLSRDYAISIFKKHCGPAVVK